MGNFIHHISGGVAAGVACGFGSSSLLHTPLVDSFACGILCCVGSLLPDVDSPNSKPTEMMFGMASVIAPVFLIQGIGAGMLTPSQIILLALGGYAAVRYGAKYIMGKVTVHRGIFHSIPMACIWGAIVYLAFRHSSYAVRNAAAISATLGFVVHLIIDEMFSFVNLEGIKISPKKSFGTAFKFFVESGLVNICTYAALFFILYVCLADSKLLNKLL